MKRVSLILFPCLLAVILAGLFVYPAFAHGATISPTRCGKGWKVVSSPNKDGSNPYPNDLYNVAAISANDVWAVGNYAVPGRNGEVVHALTEHWNGTAWSIVPTASAKGDYFYGVAAVATNDVWAVGGVTVSGTFKTLIENWNGTSWSIVPSPNHGWFPILYSVAAVSASDIWAVGLTHASDHVTFQPLIEHWNGTAWSIVASSAPSGSVSLSGVTAVSSTDVWAMGVVMNGAAGQPLIEHWDGTSWTIVANPTLNGALSGVAAVSATDIWAVGALYSQSAILIEHWNGTKWKVVQGPNASGGLGAVSVVSKNNVWAVGNGLNGTLIVHWNGTTWKTVSSPSVSHSLLSGLTAVPGTTSLWTVGTYSSKRVGRTLTEFHC
ncbi:MAG TPA: hypothetical protein VNG51_07940 [Ktedonobacteraceae bacterium]|nr:hypothetical protein [Ktedonobacteraceae bacterium]